MKLNWNKIPKFCISLKRSKERRIAMSKEFVKIGLIINEDVMFFDAVDKKDLILPELSEKYKPGDGEGIRQNALGAYACMLSHLEIIRMAKKTGLKAVCIFEDDIVFCNDFKEKIDYIESICNNKSNGKEDGFDVGGFTFEMLCLGGHFPSGKPGELGKHGDQTNWNRIYKTNALSGTYGYIITDKIYDFVLRNCSYQYGMDQFYQHVYERFNCYSFLPFLVGHKPGKSEITGADWHYENADWFYEQNKVDLSKPYINHILKEEERLKREQDERREAYLRTQ